ncbi:hypothetical protein ACJJTC_019437 [Scirpophaga incertulas]
MGKKEWKLKAKGIAKMLIPEQMKQTDLEVIRLNQSAENIAAVRESVQENPRKSISRRSQELVLFATSTWRIVRRDLGLHPYEIQLTKELKASDHTTPYASGHLATEIVRFNALRLFPLGPS